jgi:hypothetical protein
VYFCHRFFFFLDVMHMLDCKGAASNVFGGLIYYVVRMRALGSSQVLRLRFVNQWIVKWYDNHTGSNRLPAIFLKNIMSIDGWADLHGPVIKAAATREAAPLFADMTRELFTGAGMPDVQLRTVTRALCDIYNSIYSGPMFPNMAELDILDAACVQFGEAFQSLREYGRVNGQLTFPITPKVHKTQHLRLLATLINPRFVNVYADESLIGTTMKVYKKTMSGRYKQHVQRNVLLKRAVGLFLRFEV